MVQLIVRLLDSQGIPQGGLEIPCRLIFKGLEKYVNMTSSKLKAKDKTSRDAPVETRNEAVNVEATSNVVDLMQESKRPKLCDAQGNEEVSIGQEAGEHSEWVRIFVER